MSYAGAAKTPIQSTSVCTQTDVSWVGAQPVTRKQRPAASVASRPVTSISRSVGTPTRGADVQKPVAPTSSDMLDVLGWTPLSQSRQEARLILFYKIINGVAQVPFEGVLVEAYKGTRRKHNMKFRQIGHTTSQYGQSFFPKTISAWNGLAFAEAPSLAVFSSNFLKISVHPFCIIP